jgi:IPT/TIG domain
MARFSRLVDLALIATAFVAADSASAQMRFPGAPQGSRHGLAAPVAQFDVPAPDVAFLKHEDLTPRVGPLRYGVVIPMYVDITSDGDYEVTPDNKVVFRVKVKAEGAYSLGFEFSQFDLPQGGQLFVHDERYTHVFGAYEAINVIPDTGEFVIEPFPGDTAILEYSQPLAATKLGKIVIRAVIYDYKDVFRLERDLNELESNETEGGCALVDVNCPEGAPYPNHKRAAIRTLFGGGLCSASLINNTANDATRYVYTANHCGQGSTTVFRFNYQTSGCATGSAPTTQQVSGATFLANDVDTDGRLLRINGVIPSNYSPYYAGWSRSTSNLTLGVSMHHPGGGPKKLSIDSNGGGQTTANFAGIGAVKVWAMNFNVGSTEGGSSGGPLFDQNSRIRGTLTGGPTSPCTVSYYGRFFSFWNEVNIAQYLDPLGTNPTTLDGFDPATPPPAPTITTVSPTSVKAYGGALVTLNGTNFTGATAVTVGSTQLTGPPIGFQVVNATTITFAPPTPTALGNANVTVTNAAGTSAPKTLTYVETQPLAMNGPIFMINGQNASWSWGGKANQIAFFNYSLTLNTTTLNGQTFLLYLGSVPVANTNAVGLGSLTVPITGVPVGTIIHTQVMTVAPPGTNISSVQLSNIVTSQTIG